jgi:HK97 family phage prohead protease
MMQDEWGATATAEVSEEGLITGYASVFWEVDGDHDAMVPGAFADSLRSGQPVALLWQHQTNQPIGKIEALKEDGHGLWMQARLNMRVQAGREAFALLKQGGVSGLSVGFQVLDYDMDAASGVRFITNVRLWEVSVVTFPANAAARVHGVKSHPL